MKRKRTERASRLQMKRARQIPLSGTVEQTVKSVLHFIRLLWRWFHRVLFFSLSLSLLDVEHRKSFAEMTEAQVHPASSASAPEGFLNPQDNPNGNENSIGSTRYHFICDFKNCNRFGFLLHKVRAVCAARLLFQISGHCWIKDQILSAKSGPICWWKLRIWATLVGW